jgi:hypothetical protein
MKIFLANIILLVVLLLVVNPQYASALDSPEEARQPISASFVNSNPFGVMFADTGKVEIAKELGVAYYRPISVFVNRWNGSCPECDAAVAAGLNLVLTVRNNGGLGQPTTPPTDLVSYKKIIGEIIEKYKPVVLVVENEENSKALFYSGTPEQYNAQLAAACEVAHSQGIKCTNGGLVSSLVAMLVVEDYLNQGESLKAEDYLKRTLGSKLEAKFGSKQMRAADLLDKPKTAGQLAKGKALLTGYKDAGADYVNFHWYIADTGALKEAIDYLQRVTGLPAITNEVGQQRNSDPEQVTAVMQKVLEIGIPIAIWFSVDVPGYGQAKSLVDADGNLRQNGEAYKSFLKKNF